MVGSVDLSLVKGDSLHFLQLARWIRRRGHDVRIVGRGASLIAGYEELDVECFAKLPSKYLLLLDDANYLRKLSTIIKGFKPEVVYQRGVPYLNNVAGSQGCPAIVEVNGLSGNELRLRGTSWPIVKLVETREAKTVQGADHIICVTDGVKRLLVQSYDYPADKCTVLANGADTDLFRPMPIADCKRKLGLKPEMYTVGFVGAFQPWVDFGTLMRATRQLVDEDLELHLVLVGDGPREAEVLQMVQSLNIETSVSFIGRVPHEEVPAWIGAFDVAVAPFDFSGRGFEGSPLKLFEYMACGRPVVATDVPATAEFIRNGNAGLLYPVGEGDFLASRIRQLAEDEQLRIALGQNGYEQATKYHSWDSVAEQVELIATDLLRKRRS